MIPLVERIEILEKEIKQLMARVVTLESNKGFRFPRINVQEPIQRNRWKTERKLSSSISQQRNDKKKVIKDKNNISVSNDASDIGNGSDIDEN